MPTYEYVCTACDHRFEDFESMSAKPQVKCPACGKRKLRRLFGTGAGIIFKGSGFYETDYKKKTGSPSASETAGKKAESDAKSGTKPESKTESKSESKPDSKTESKPESKPAPKPPAKKDSKKKG
jgi:putative FmdB family regulatory protein